MKKILYIISVYLLFFSGAYSQDNVSLSVFQDLKFAVKGDTERGYKAGTLDLLFRFKMQGNQQKYGYIVVSPEFEYAEIQGLYRRYSVNLGYTFNRLVLDNFELTPMASYGWIDRGLAYESFGGSLELMYKLNKRIKIGVLNQLTHRTDLPNRKIGYSFFVGLEVNLK